jgi:hypothetical protein
MAVINGDRQLAELGARLKVVGDATLRRSVQARIRLAAKPLIPIIQQSARDSLPKAGGMNEFVAKRRPRTSVRFGARSAAVRITYKGKGAPSDKGPWRHPVFGNRQKWVSEEYKPAEGWWERAEEKGTPLARVAMSGVLEEVAREVNGRGI